MKIPAFWQFPELSCNSFVPALDDSSTSPLNPSFHPSLQHSVQNTRSSSLRGCFVLSKPNEFSISRSAPGDFDNFLQSRIRSISCEIVSFCYQSALRLTVCLSSHILNFQWFFSRNNFQKVIKIKLRPVNTVNKVKNFSKKFIILL